MKDMRRLGTSYGYVAVPKGGLRVDGVKFPEGVRPAGKRGWFKLLLMAGCEEVSQADYEAFLAGQDPVKETADGNEPVLKAAAKASSTHRRAPRKDKRLPTGASPLR